MVYEGTKRLYENKENLFHYCLEVNNHTLACEVVVGTMDPPQKTMGATVLKEPMKIEIWKRYCTIQSSGAPKTVQLLFSCVTVLLTSDEGEMFLAQVDYDASFCFLL